MICAGTILRLYDNSGVKRVKVLKGPHKHFLPGNIITVTIKRVVPKRFRSKRKEI
jgi:ribosomal protein L14